MNPTDSRILRLIDLLIYQKKVSSIKDFCIQIEMLEQTISKIKKGYSHFTVGQIESICKTFNVNANWIFGLDKKVFNSVSSVELSEIN